MPFRFRQFTIDDLNSSMRVGTDSMLLGSWAAPLYAGRILDIGTGCGVLALMMAQKSKGTIEAIDIDQASCLEAEQNFRNSPWADRLTIIHSPLQNFSRFCGKPYDFIISNPPFFSNFLHSPCLRKNITRHELTLGRHEMIHIVRGLLSEDGRFTLILPFAETERFLGDSEQVQLFPSRQLTLYSRPGSAPIRTMLEMSVTKTCLSLEPDLTIYGSDGRFTADYLSLTVDFHNF